MCGIAGWSAERGAVPAPSVLNTVLAALGHRGPDGSGSWFDDERGLALGHRRLAILDLSERSAQPMSDAAGATLVFNGELYNYKELRVELQATGSVFRSSGDAEVVLAALSTWGRAALPRFCGMFALAYVAARSSRLLLARDPLGIKPLLMAQLPSRRTVLFASELRALLASDLVGRSVDPEALTEYLDFGYAFNGHRSMVSGVERVGPGEWVEVEAGCVAARGAYYTIPQAASTDSAPGDDDLLGTLEEVVGQHLVADVPVGVLLSGGLDSSVIAALAARHGRVRTLSFGFADSGIDERPQARAVAQAIGSSHTELLLDPEDIVRELEERADVFDDLIGDGAVLSTRLAYREARRQGLKVVLVGEGADELFGGYPMFAAAALLRGPSSWRRFQLYRRYAGRRFGRSFREFNRDFGSVHDATPSAWIDAVRRFELRHQVPNQFNMKVDRASMAESIEARTPYLDRRVVEVGMRCGAARLGVGAEGKRPLRRVAARLGVLPEAIVNRPKFGIALAPEWLDSNASLRSLARRSLLQSGDLIERLPARRAIRAYLVHDRKGLRFPSPYSVLQHVVWRLLVFVLWARRLSVSM